MKGLQTSKPPVPTARERIADLQEECEEQRSRTADQFDRAEKAEAEVERLKTAARALLVALQTIGSHHDEAEALRDAIDAAMEGE